MTVKSRLKKRSVRFKFLLSYLVTLLLPFLLVGLFFYPESTEIIERNAVISAETQLSYVNTNISDQMRDIWNYASSLYTNPDLGTSIFRNESETGIYRIITEMKKILDHDSFIYNAILFNKENNRIYTKSASFSAGWYNVHDTDVFFYPKWDLQSMYQYLDDISTVAFRPEETVLINRDSKSVVTIMVSIPYNNVYSYAVLLLMVPAEEFYRMEPVYSVDSVQTPGGNIVIVDKDNRVLTASSRPDYMNSSDFQTFLAAHPDRYVGKTELGGQKYLVCVQNSSSSELRFLNLIPYSTILQDITRLQTRTTIMILGILAIGLLLIYFLMVVNYRPIQRIGQLVLGQHESRNRTGQYDEFGAITNAFEDLQQRNRDIQQQIAQIKDSSQEYFFVHYLNGSVDSADDILQKAQMFNVRFKERCCCIAFHETNRDIHGLHGLLKGLNQELGQSREDLSSYLVKGVAHADFFIIMFFDDDQTARDVQGRFLELAPTIKVGIGTRESSREPGKSYTISMMALESAILSEEINVAKHEDITIKNSALIKQLYDEMSKLELAVSCQDIPRIEAHYDQLIGLVCTKVRRIVILQVIFTNIYNIMARELNRCHYRHDYSYGIYESTYHIKGELEKLRDLKNALIKNLREKRKPAADNEVTDIRQVLDYLEENFTMEDLSLQKVADQFGYSYSNLSHYFKKETDETFTGYLEKLRISQAKKLLVSSDASIEAIARQVGYINANSFTRAFKKRELVSPGQYRKK